MKSSRQLLRRVRSPWLAGLPLLLVATPALAHHPFAMPDGAQLSVWQGLISGLGHPLLGPDHLLFLLALGLVGFSRPRRWLLPMLIVGLGGSAFAQFAPLADSAAPVAEAAVSLSLVVEGLVILQKLPMATLLPAMALHGYLLGGTIVGAEPTPLLGYMTGLALVQSTFLLMATAPSRWLHCWLGDHNRQLLAAVWIGIGSAFAWSILIP